MSLAARTVPVVLLLVLAWPAGARGDDEPLLSPPDVARIQRLLAEHRYGEVRKELALLSLAVSRHSEAVRAEFARLHADVAIARTRWLGVEVPARLVATARAWMLRRVQEKGEDDRTTSTWVDETLAADLFARLAKDLEPHDRVTTEEVRAAWAARRRGPWHEAPWSPQRHLPTASARRAWWRGAAAQDRADWLFFRFVERSGLFELGTSHGTPCPGCLGTGLVSRALRSGEVLSTPCGRCGGAGLFAVLRWR